MCAINCPVEINTGDLIKDCEERIILRSRTKLHCPCKAFQITGEQCAWNKMGYLFNQLFAEFYEEVHCGVKKLYLQCYLEQPDTKAGYHLTVRMEKEICR
jgi:hypothetical protein